MEENSLTIAILREIRDNTAKTNDRLDTLTERVASLESLTTTMAATQVRQGATLQHIDARLGGIDERLGGIDERLGGIDERLSGIDERLSGIDERLGGIDETLDRHESALETLVAHSRENAVGVQALLAVTRQLHERIDYVYAGPINAALSDHEARIRRLEGRTD